MRHSGSTRVVLFVLGSETTPLASSLPDAQSWEAVEKLFGQTGRVLSGSSGQAVVDCDLDRVDALNRTAGGLWQAVVRCRMSRRAGTGGKLMRPDRRGGPCPNDGEAAPAARLGRRPIGRH